MHAHGDRHGYTARYARDLLTRGREAAKVDHDAYH
mgnify:CR=1 FL=1